MKMARVDGEAQAIAGRDPGRAGKAGRDRRTATDDLAVHHGISAERLDQGDLDVQRPVVAVGERQMLGPQAERRLSAGVIR